MAVIRRDKIVDVGRKKIDVRVEIYESAAQVVEDGRNRQVRINGYDIKKADIHKSWHGVDSYDEALNLLENGYQPTVEELRGELKVDPKEGARFSFKNEIQGFAPVVPLALKGIPNCMMDMKMKPIKAKVLDVYYDMTASSRYEPDDFIKAGKALLGTIIELEKQGYRFNLYALQTYTESWDGKTADMLCVKIKSSDKPIDLKRISFPLTHPSFFRVIGFDWQSKSPIARDIGCGRGCALGYNYDKRETKQIAQEMFGSNACYIACSQFIDSGYDKESLKEAFTNVAIKK